MTEKKYFEVAVHYSDGSTTNYMVRACDAWQALTVLNATRKPSRTDKQVTYVNSRCSIYGEIIEGKAGELIE